MTPLGPEGFDGIAIIGSAPSSVTLAPYLDQKWAIWCTSPGVFGVASRSDVWFELHRFHPAEPGRNQAPGTKPWFSSEFTAFLAKHKLVMMNDLYPEIPNGVRYPFEKMIEKYGRYHWTSSVAWMLALAIECKPKRIGLWGIDMAHDSEWGYQRPACQHFIGLALSQGIEVVLPPESDLMQPPAMYGLTELNPRHIKLRARLDEFNQRLNSLVQEVNAKTMEMRFLEGARDDANYMLSSWADDIPFKHKDALSMAGHFNEATALKTPEWNFDVARDETGQVSELKVHCDTPVAKPKKRGRPKGNGIDAHP